MDSTKAAVEVLNQDGTADCYFYLWQSQKSRKALVFLSFFTLFFWSFRYTFLDSRAGSRNQLYIGFKACSILPWL